MYVALCMKAENNQNVSIKKIGPIQMDCVAIPLGCLSHLHVYLLLHTPNLLIFDSIFVFSLLRKIVDDSFIPTILHAINLL